MAKKQASRREEPTKLQRQLDLIAFLVGRRWPVQVDELMQGIPAYASKLGADDAASQDSVRRMFERDKDDLRSIGIPIRTLEYEVDGQVQEGYVIQRRDFYLPYLRLVSQAEPDQREYLNPARAATVNISEEDAPLALEALRRVAEVPSFPFADEARSAFRKLAFDLDPAAFTENTPVLFVDRPGAAELAGILRVLSDALMARKRVTFSYRGMYRGEEAQRDVASYGLLFQNGNWYLIGHDRMRDDVRVFRVGRITSLERNRRAPGTPDYDIPADFDLKDYTGRQPWELGDEDASITAKVRFRFPQNLWAARNHYGVLDFEESDGSAVRTFEVHQVSPFLRWVLTLQDDAEIIEPGELREELHRMARDIAAAHAEGA